jgi:hypothetical protein
MNAVTCQVSALRHSAAGAQPRERDGLRAAHRYGRRRGRGPGRRGEAELGRPQGGGEQGRDGPQAEAQADRPGAAAGGLEHGHRDERGYDGARRQGQQVEADEQAGPLGLAPLDQAGREHVEQGDRAARDDRAGEQQDAGRDGAQRQAGGQQDQGGAEHALLAEAAGQRRAGAGEHPEAEHRDGGQDGLPGRRQVQGTVQLREERRQAGDGRPHAGRQGEDPGDQQPGPARPEAGPASPRKARPAR